MGLVSKGYRRLLHIGPIDFIYYSLGFLIRKLLPYHFGRFNRLLITLFWLLNGRIVRRSGKFWKVSSILARPPFFSRTLEETLRFDTYNTTNLRDRYFHTDGIKVRPEDTVFVVGGYIGDDFFAVPDVAGEVYALEPSPRNFEVLEMNARGLKNANAINVGAWHKNEEREINFGVDPSKDSVIEPSGGKIDKEATVKMRTISHIAKKEGVEVIDFLKVEAEGVEPEVVEGIQDVEVRKIVSSGGFERCGNSTQEAVADQLNEYGYHVEFGSTHEVYAVHKDHVT